MLKDASKVPKLWILDLLQTLATVDMPVQSKRHYEGKPFI